MVDRIVLMAVLLMGTVCCGSGNGQDAALRSLPVCNELPDPFVMNGGKRVQTVTEWRRRREEIRELLLRYQYGHMPPAPGNVAIDSELASEVRNGGKTLRRKLRLKMGPGQRIKMTLHLYLPHDKPGPHRAVVRIGLGCPVVEEMNERGYVFACFEHRDLDPETEGHDVAGPAQRAYPKHDWGSIAVWAWGASRVLDFLTGVAEVNKDRIIITGHSRTGKAALLAGALDERIAVVVPNGSGCGGAGCYRIANRGAETLELITRPTRFLSWFQKDFGRFSGEENRLPFDQHFLKAMVAPRALLTTDALDDKWANPLGNQATHLAAQPVFDFLGASENNAMFFREGKHDQLPEDFRALLAFADGYFAGKPAARAFRVLPFPEYRPKISWRAPVSADAGKSVRASWINVTSKAAFSPRDTAEDLVFAGTMWLSNGYYHGNVLTRDLWSSKDGVTWRRVNANTPYDGYSELVVYDNRMWAIKGSVWCSTDGVNWKRVAERTPFGTRGYGEAVVYEGKIWQLGSGEDVWHTTDGVNWKCVTKNAPYGKRTAAAVVVFGKKLWLMGGKTPGANTPPEKGYKDITTHNDVWCSTDGARWTRVLAHAPWAPRQWFIAKVYRSKMWIIGGHDNVNSANFGDVWYTEDGKNWHEFVSASRFSPRHEPTCYVYDDSLWVVGGNSWPVQNDVWRLTVPRSRSPWTRTSTSSPDSSNCRRVEYPRRQEKGP